MNLRWMFLLLLGSASPTFAAGIDIEIEIPQIDVAEYHRPYVAAWIEDDARALKAQVFVWYQQRATKEGEGTKWLPDMRQWWRRGGRELKVPVDGVTGATRPPGRHAVHLDATSAPLLTLAPGNYRLVVEAAREVGGREVLDIAFVWPPTRTETTRVSGQHEISAIALELIP